LARDPVIVLVSLDGVGFSFLVQHSNYTPNLNRIRNAGLTAKFIPSYPTKTWPNHYTIMTGLYPSWNGIVANKFYDPPSKRMFASSDPATVKDPYFYLGRPFWSQVKSAGMKSACTQFPTCDVAYNGESPTYLKEYDQTQPNYQRIQDVLSWVDMTADKQPSFIATYMSDVDDVAHMFGPNNVHTMQALRELDANLGTLYDALKTRSTRFDIDLIIVSDHGFLPIEGRIFIDDFINVTDFSIPELDGGSTPQLAIWAPDNRVSSLIGQLQNIPNATVYLKEDLPERWHYNSSVRIAPVHIIAKPGFLITTRSYYLAHPNEFVGGNHGWEPEIESMAGIFIGAGPSFKNPGTPISQAPSIQNVELYNLMATILDFTPVSNNGTTPFQKGILHPRYESGVAT
jgi:predicted AlkP superfamily pyrophosphatase or phosphodiesterase